MGSRLETMAKLVEVHRRALVVTSILSESEALCVDSFLGRGWLPRGGDELSQGTALTMIRGLQCYVILPFIRGRCLDSWFGRSTYQLLPYCPASLSYPVDGFFFGQPAHKKQHRDLLLLMKAQP